MSCRLQRQSLYWLIDMAQDSSDREMAETAAGAEANGAGEEEVPRGKQRLRAVWQ